MFENALQVPFISDLIFLLLILPILFVVWKFLDRVARCLSKWLIDQYSNRSFTTKEKRRAIDLFAHDFPIFALDVFLGPIVLLDCWEYDWFWDQNSIFAPNVVEPLRLKLSSRGLLLIQMGIHISKLTEYVCTRSGFRVRSLLCDLYVWHHILTVVGFVLCYAAQPWCGVLVFMAFIATAQDCLAFPSKLFHVVHFEAAATFFFVVICLPSWFYMRCFLMSSVLYAAIVSLMSNFSKETNLKNGGGTTTTLVLLPMFTFLCVLQWYWFFEYLVMLYVVLTKGPESVKTREQEGLGIIDADGED